MGNQLANPTNTNTGIHVPLIPSYLIDSAAPHFSRGTSACRQHNTEVKLPASQLQNLLQASDVKHASGLGGMQMQHNTCQINTLHSCSSKKANPTP
jgi:hypothetical protein